MLERALGKAIPARTAGYPVILIAGPRQSGKTTLAKASFPSLPYVNFESPTERAAFVHDPVGFLERYPVGAVVDEVQHEPAFLSHLQVRVDADGGRSRWVLTGSQQIELVSSTAQSLAGRLASLELHPFSHVELVRAGRASTSLAEAVFRGGYPPLYDETRPLDPLRWLDDYLLTVLRRDVPQAIGVRNLSQFELFVRQCAGRSGQLLNQASLARDVGIDAKTAAAWLSVLEGSFLVRLLRPHHRNFGKRLVKAPKLHFLDTGLVCRLLGIQSADALRTSHVYGPLVESWAYSELLKRRTNRGVLPDLFHFRSSDGIEVDLLIEDGERLTPIEVRAARTAAPRELEGLARFRALSARDSIVTAGAVVYAGDEEVPMGRDRFVAWSSLDATFGG